MKKLFAFICFCFFFTNISAQNPYLPLWEHLPDGEPRVFEDPDNPGKYRAYIIGSHDVRFGSYCGPDIRVWSAPVEDLTNWRDDGAVFTHQVDEQWDVMYAPDLVEIKKKDGTKEFYLYPHSRGPNREAMVAKGNRPNGPFTPINLTADGKRTVPGSILGFDPSVYIEYVTDPNDPDFEIGFRAYGYWGFQRSLAAELDQKTMYSLRPGRQIINYFIPASSRYGVIRDPEGTTYPCVAEDENLSGFNFFEASSIRKVGNKYVMVFSGYSGPDYGLGSTNSALRYAFSDAPQGPWRSGGVLVDSRAPVVNQDGTALQTSYTGHNTHGSIELINDQWYAFYHRAPRGFGNARQPMVAPVKIEWDEKPVADGGKVTIRAYDPFLENNRWTAKAGNVEYTGAEVTSEGFNIYGLPPYGYYSAGIACYLSSPGNQQDSWDIWDNHMPITNVANGHIIGYKYFGFGGLAEDKKGLKAFEGTQPGNNTKFNLYLTPKTANAFKVNVWLDGYQNSGAWKGTKIGEINVSENSPQETAQFTVDVSAFVDNLDKKHAIFLVAEGGSGSLFDLIGLGFSSDKKAIVRPAVPTVGISVNGAAIDIPTVPVRSTNLNGIVGYDLYETTFTLSSGTTQTPTVTASASSPEVKATITQADTPFGTAVVKFDYHGVVKTYRVVFVSSGLNAHEELYPHAFPLSSVRLLEGPLKHALDLNVKVLFQYDTDRLLAPFLREAGLPKKAEIFPNWQGLDGHIAGHYLSALAIHYAATGNEELKKRMEYVIAEMRRCQLANGDGYLGGVPNGKRLWNDIKGGNPQVVWNYWVPWYNVHKTFAGLRDAWYYAGNELAKEMFLELCDWGVSVISPLSDEQMKTMVGQEYGGMNEVYADAYQMTGNERYLWAAKRFGSDYLFDGMSVRKDELDNRHANTQVPKSVGYLRTGEVSGDKLFTTAGEFFWETVVNNRSLSLGGNSRREHFPSKDDCINYTQEREGPESCNTYNMLKLTKGLFRMNPQAKYADYYERAMFNHILSTQHPEHGGYVYFTSARPAHYRNYSSPNSAMWCCVGTGMENHGKYGEFVYTHSGDSLYVNLFVASELDWKAKGIKLIQNTQFPTEESSKLTIKTDRVTPFTMMIRYPWWVQQGQMKVMINGRDYPVEAEPSSYIAINRRWRNDDIVEIIAPMKITIEELPNEPNFISILRGPVVLGAQVGTQDLRGLVADDGRWAHIAHGSLVSLFGTPPIIGTRNEIQSKLENMQPVAGKPFNFTVPGLFADVKYKDLILEPFHQIHDSRYMIYWLSATSQGYDEILRKKQEEERQKLNLDARTIDVVNAGEQQPEADHLMKHQGTQSGSHKEELWRNARPGGYFQYEMKTDRREDLTLMVRYWGNETGNREFNIFIDDQLLVTEDITGKWNKNEFVNVEYKIPVEILRSKTHITVKFTGTERSNAGRVFFVRLLKK